MLVFTMYVQLLTLGTHVLRAHAYCDRIRTNRAISCNVINIIKLASQFHRFVFVTLLLIRHQQLLPEHQQLLTEHQQLLPKHLCLLPKQLHSVVTNTFQFCLDQQQYYMYMYM